MRRAWPLIIGGFLSLMGSCDQSVTEGNTDQLLSDVTLADGGADGVVTTDTAVEAAIDAAVGPTVTVTYGGQKKVVGLNQPTPVTFEGFPSVRMSDVVLLAFPAVNASGVTMDFMAGDGFKPGSKSTCDGLIPVAGTEMVKGYIDVSSRKLRWEFSLGYPGCLYVQDLAEIQIADT